MAHRSVSSIPTRASPHGRATGRRSFSCPGLRTGAQISSPSASTAPDAASLSTTASQTPRSGRPSRPTVARSPTNAERAGRRILRPPGPNHNPLSTQRLEPLWSPTGRSIAATVAGNYNSGLDVTDLTTGARRVIAPIPRLVGVDFTPLAWSPDGRRLLYQRTCADLRPPECVTAVYVRTIATGKDKRVSVDGQRWILARWHGHTITYVTQPQA